MSRAKSWKFAVSNSTDKDLTHITSVCKETCDWSIVSKTEDGLLGYCCFKEKARFSTRFSPDERYAAEVLSSKKGTQPKTIKLKCFEECAKTGIVWNQNCLQPPKEIKTISEDRLYDWQENIVNVIHKDPDERTIHWYWSESGNVGKTSFQKFLCVHYGAVMLGGKAADCMNGIVDYKKNTGDVPSIVLVNIPRSQDAQYISYQAYEAVKDMCFYSGKYEGGMIVGNCPHLFIFANQLPSVEKMSADRWNIVNIDPPGYTSSKRPAQDLVVAQLGTENIRISSGHKDDECDSDVPDFPSHEASAHIDTLAH